MKDFPHERLRETNWRRGITPAEEADLRAWLSAHPEAANDWELEQNLTGMLEHLPNAPVPSNFTARVLQEAQRQAARDSRTGGRAWWRRGARFRWIPRVALATVLLLAGLLSYEHLQISQRRERAESVREIVSFTAFPGPEILQDYDAIQAMSQSPAADVELLKALQ